MGNKSSKKPNQNEKAQQPTVSIPKPANNVVDGKHKITFKHQVLARPPKVLFGDNIYCKYNDDGTYNLFLLTRSRQYDGNIIARGIWKYDSKVNSWSHIPNTETFHASRIFGNAMIGDKMTVFLSRTRFGQYDTARNRICTIKETTADFRGGSLVIVKELDEMHFMRHSGRRCESGRHVIYRNVSWGIKHTYGEAFAYDAIDYETQIKDTQLIYCSMLKKILSVGGELMDIPSDDVSEAKLGNYREDEQGVFEPTNKIWTFVVGNNQKNEWELTEWRLPFTANKCFRCVLGFDHVLFVFYCLDCVEGYGRIWCLDLLSGEGFEIERKLPTVNEFRIAKEDDVECVNLLYTLDDGGHYSIEHISFELKDLLPLELIEIYSIGYPVLIAAICRNLNAEIVRDVILLISRFCSKLCAL